MIYNQPIGRFFTTYIPLIVLANWGIIRYRSHLLREAETTTELGDDEDCCCEGYILTVDGCSEIRRLKTS